MPPPDKKYILNAYSALKDNLDGFDKSPEEFEHLVTTDNGYRSKVYTALKDNLDGFDKSQYDFDKAIGVEQKPLPTIQQQTPDIGISPAGTFQNKPDNHELPSVNGDIQSLPGIPTQHDVKQKETANASIKTAIDNSAKKKVDKLKKDGFPVTKKTEDFYRDQLKQQHDNGDLVVDKENGEPTLKRTTGFLESAVNAVNDAAYEDAQNKIIAGLSNKEKIDYLKVKPIIDAKYKSNSVADGLTGEAGKFIGSNADMLAKGAVAGVTAGTLAPELIGAGSFASYVSMADQFAKSNYSAGLQKTYHALVQQGMPEEQAMEEAHKAGLMEEATGLASLAFLSGAPKGLNTTPAAAKGLLNGIVKSAGKVAGMEAPKMGIVTGAQTLVNDLAEQGVGVKKKPGEILNDVAEGVGHGALIGSAFYIMQNPGKVLSYLRPQAENVIASMPKEQREAYIKTAQQEGVMPEGSVEKVEQKVQEFTKAKEPLENLPIPDENKAAIAGKILQKQKLQDELSNLQKHGEAFAPRIEELTNEISGIEKDMAGMYKAKDVFDKEKDSVTGETTKENDVSLKENNPSENGEQNETNDTRPKGKGYAGKQDMASDAEPLQQPKSQEVSPIWRQGDNRVRELEQQLREISERYGAEANPETFNREDRQRWELLSRELQMGDGQGATRQPTSNNESGVQGADGAVDRLSQNVRSKATGNDAPNSKYEDDGRGSGKYSIEEANNDNTSGRNIDNTSMGRESRDNGKGNEGAIGKDVTRGSGEPPTEQVIEANKKEAIDYGFVDHRHAVNSVNNRLGTDYKEYHQIPKDQLEKVSRERTIQEVKPIKEFTSKRGHTLKSENGSVTVVNKSGEEVARETKKKVIYEAANSYDFTQGKEAPQPEQPLANDDEFKRHVVENSTNPTELAEIYLGEEPQQSGLSSKEQMIAEYGLGKITEKSYRRHGDKNSQNHNKARAYFSKDGIPIDVRAKEISDHYDADITPQDIVDFIDRFPNGGDAALASRESSIAKSAKDRFSELTGLPLDDKVAEIAVRQRKMKIAENIPDEAANIIFEEGITADNIDQLKHLFDGFPYSPEDFAAIKSKLGKENQDSGSTRQVSEAGKSGESAKTDRHYEEIAGSKPSNKTGRIPVDPIIGGTPKNISHIIRDISKSLSQKLFFAKPGRRNAIGTYAPGSTGIKIRFNGDLDTTAHELGHSLDDAFSIIKNLKTVPDKVLEAELNKFSSYGSKPPKGYPDARMYKLGEGFAEWLRARVVNPTEAIKQAPELNKIYEAKVSDKYKKAIDQFSTDVRTWSGATGRDITLANIEWKPEEAEGILKTLFKKKGDGFTISWADKLAANFVNPLHAFEKAWKYAKKLKGIGEVLPEDDPTILSRLLLSVDMKAGEFLTHGLRDTVGNLVKDANGNVKNFSWLLEPLDNTDQATVKNEMQDTMAYMVAERTIELSKKFNREDVLSGVGGGIYKDIDVAKKTLDEFTNGDPNKLARIKEASERYRSFSNDILQYLADKGRMAQRITDKDGNLIGGIDFIKQNNLQYVAMRRIIETEPEREIEVFQGKGGRLTSVSEPVKTIKGSTKGIVNPYISLLDTMFKSIKEADRNDVLRSFREVLVSSRGMHNGEPVKLADVAIQGATGDKNTITIFVDGKPEKWLLQEDVYKALKGLDHEAYRLPGILTLHAKVLRATVTKFPVFAIRNIIRDTPDRIIKSTDGSGFKDFFGDKEHWRDVARNGGLNAGYYVKDKAHYYGLMNEAIASISKNGNVVADSNIMKRAWHGYENILGKSETSNRVAEYRGALREAKKKGMDDYNASLYAAFKSRDLMDFALMGHTMKIVNQVVPFSNAAVQGLRSTYNSAVKNPVSFASRMAIYTVLPQVTLWALNHRDEQTAKQYEEMPDYQRDMFWNFKIGDNKWMAMPKPYELGLFAAGVDRTLSKTFGHNDKAFEGLAGETVKTLSPIDQSALTNSFTPELELMFNKSLFTGKHIIPENEEPLNLALRNTQNASRLGQAIQNVAGLDARKADYWIKAHFSYVGDAALKASNIGDNTKQGFDATTSGLIKRTPAYNSKSVQDMLDFVAEWDLARAPQAKAVKSLAHEYFTTQDNKEKERIAGEMIDLAKSAMAEWEPIQKEGELRSQQKAEAKRQ